MWPSSQINSPSRYTTDPTQPDSPPTQDGAVITGVPAFCFKIPYTLLTCQPDGCSQNTCLICFHSLKCSMFTISKGKGAASWGGIGFPALAAPCQPLQFMLQAPLTSRGDLFVQFPLAGITFPTWSSWCISIIYLNLFPGSPFLITLEVSPI